MGINKNHNNWRLISGIQFQNRSFEHLPVFGSDTMQTSRSTSSRCRKQTFRMKAWLCVAGISLLLLSSHTRSCDGKDMNLFSTWKISTGTFTLFLIRNIITKELVQKSWPSLSIEVWLRFFNFLLFYRVQQEINAIFPVLFFNQRNCSIFKLKIFFQQHKMAILIYKCSVNTLIVCFLF